jgi:choline dehydrogenase-like flavoprotein
LLIDASRLPSGLDLASDVVIVGSGPAGITLAEQLVASGLHVLVVESGDRHQTKAAGDRLRGRSTGAPFPMAASRQRAFAGTASHWTANTGLRVRPLDPIDFEARPGMAETGWPFSYQELEPFYRRAGESVGVDFDYDAANWLPDGGPSALSWDGGPRLALFRFADHRTFTDRFDSFAHSRQIDLLLNATATRIVTGASGSVESLEVTSPGGPRLSITGRAYVLACGGIDNARLLLASPGPNGAAVGNEHDNVGRYFTDHLSIDSGVVVANDPGVDVSSFLETRNAAGQKYQPMLWAGEDRLREHGLLNAAFWVNRLDARFVAPAVQSVRALKAALLTRPLIPGVTSHVRNAADGTLDVARFAYRRFRDSEPRETVISLRIMAEQAPHPESRITLADSRDDTGLPRAHVHWHISASDREGIRRHQDLLAAMLEDRGVGTVVDRLGEEHPAATMIANYHHMGSTRMHADPRRGVVDSLGRVHSVPNLYVAGSSVFPTGGYANPTLTIIALAIRLAGTLSASLQPVRMHALTV